MKIMVVLGTRPEIIRLSRVINALERDSEVIFIHTEQNYDPGLSNIFFQELGVRPPDVYLGIHQQQFGKQIGEILCRSEEQLIRHRPARLLILGDTNSGLSAIVARRLGVPVYHMEAGNRCLDDRVPEEVNRRLIDHVSTILLPYTHRSKENLVAEGIPRDRIFVTGNPIFEVLEHFKEKVDESRILEQLELDKCGYFLLTLHRAENVDNLSRLRQLLMGIDLVAEKHEQPIICSLHPRTRQRLQVLGFSTKHERIRFLDPMGFFNFIRLEQNASCVLSDSGTVQEECCIFGVPTVTLRDVTERPETVECGSNVLSGSDPKDILRAVGIAQETRGTWSPPAEYLVRRVSTTIVKIVTGYHVPDMAELDWRAGAIH